jgi:hypothetical protein
MWLIVQSIMLSRAADLNTAVVRALNGSVLHETHVTLQYAYL